MALPGMLGEKLMCGFILFTAIVLGLLAFAIWSGGQYNTDF
jgi:hypothetical protein